MQDSYTFGPSGVGKFRMRFAYHEIQYITISGLHAQPTLTDVIGHRLTSLGQRTGDFSCSSELISKMYDTTVNNYRGLTTGGMTVDCPHRERRGYGGDGHTSYQFALANYPVGPYFNKWMRDFADTQGVAGASDTKMPACTTPGSCWVPNTAPTVSGGGGPAWSGFVITNPYQTYSTFGDTGETDPIGSSTAVTDTPLSLLLLLLLLLQIFWKTCTRRWRVCSPSTPLQPMQMMD